MVPPVNPGDSSFAGRRKRPVGPLSAVVRLVAPALKDPEKYPGGCPLASSRVQAGFPSPADDYLEQPLNLNTYLIDNPSATFFVRASGDSMIGAGIYPNDLLIVDKSATPDSGDIVIAIIDGEFTVKRMERTARSIELHPENPAYPVLRFRPDSELEIWGVVKHVIHSY